jgi:hypothetical protein
MMYLQTGDERLWLRQLHQSFERNAPPFQAVLDESRGPRARYKVRLPGILRHATETVVRWAAIVQAKQST